MALSTSPSVPLPVAALRQPRAPSSDAAPALRLIAGFCPTRAEALRLHAELCGHLRLQPAQALLLSPAELGSPRLAQCLQRWRVWRQAATPAPAAGTLAVLLAALVRALLAVAHGATDHSMRPSRFDRTVQRRLAQGLHAVVVQQPRGQYTCNYLLETMRHAGVSWCAEAPRRLPQGAQPRPSD